MFYTDRHRLTICAERSTDSGTGDPCAFIAHVYNTVTLTLTLTLTLYPLPYTRYLILEPYTRYPLLDTLYPTPYTLYPTPYTLYHIPYSLYPSVLNVLQIPALLYGRCSLTQTRCRFPLNVLHRSAPANDLCRVFYRFGHRRSMCVHCPCI